jgi:hypothetical protein
MQLTLRPEEAALLRQVLTNYLSDLRMEIGKTEKYDWRQALKRDEALLNELLVRLQQASAPSALGEQTEPRT